MSKKSFIDSVEVGAPCSEDWDKMHGNDRVRFCSHCSKDVKNLSAVTRKEAMRLVRSSGDSLCIRYVKHPVSNRPVFAGQLIQITRRAPGIAAGVMSASISLSSLAYAQGGSVSSAVAQASPGVSVTAKEKGDPIKGSDRSSVVGLVLDPNGAVIPNAAVLLTNKNASDTKTVRSNDDGEYRFDDVASGAYLIQANAEGFAQHTAGLVVSAEKETKADLDLKIGIIEITVDIVSDVTVESTVSGGIGFTEYASTLHRAVADDELEKVRELIGQGADVNRKDENYNKITPLFIAVENGSVEIARLLLDHGAKVNARDSDKQTPLMRLDADASPELVKLLVTNGAKLNLTDGESNTAIILAADVATPEVLQALIDAGADVNVANNEGQTALMNAAERDAIESVRVLVMANAKINVKNKEGDTAIDLTSEKDIEELLANYGAHRRPEN